MKELFWAAGFLEGEGSFRFNATRKNSRSGTPAVVAFQCEHEPLVRLHTLLGGNLRRHHPKHGQPGWVWCAYGPRAASIMMTLYSLMESRRKAQIKQALFFWRTAPGSTWGEHRFQCKHGHAYPENRKRYPSKSSRSGFVYRCAECVRGYWQKGLERKANLGTTC